MKLPKALRTTGLDMKNTVAELIAHGLVRHRVSCIFGQSVPSLLLMACEQNGIRQIAYRAENAGGYMADGYARISGQVAVVTAQNGPGATLLVPAFAEALKASIPIIALVQDVNRSQTDKNAFQELDHSELFKSCTKWSRRVTEAARVEDYVDLAFIQACSGRPGPVALLLPADLLLESAAESKRRMTYGAYPLDRSTASQDRVSAAAAAIIEAERPIVVAGGGIHVSHAHDALADLQELAHLPVATTVMGKGAVDENHPLSVGVVGYFMGPNGRTRYLRDMVEQADLVLLVGTRTNQNGTDSWTLYPSDAKYIHIDVDGTEIGRNYEAVRLVGDANECMRALSRELRAHDLSKRSSARTAVERKIADGKMSAKAESHELCASDQVPIRPERVMTELQAVLTDRTIVVADASYSSIWSANYLTSLRPGMRFLAPRGLAGLGWGFPMAMGAKLAQPGAPVFCITGDGGFAHVWSELETARRLGIAVTLLVLNNGILGYQKHAENVKFGMHSSAVDFAAVDHAAIAKAAGCIGIRVESPNELGKILRECMASSTTTLIDVICDENAFPPITAFTSDD